MSLNTETPPLLLVVCALGAFAGFALGQVMNAFWTWFRSRYPSPDYPRPMARIAGFAFLMPFGVVGLLVSDALGGGPDEDGFFIFLLAGWFVVILWDLRRWIRARA